MKKLIFGFILSAVLSVFAFAGKIGTFESSSGAKYNIMADESHKTIYATYIYMSAIQDISTEKLTDTEKKLQALLCNDPQARHYINNGYRYVIEYIYSNGVIARFTISNCSI